MTMKIDYKENDLNPGTWFSFEEDKPDEGGVCVRIMNNEAIDEMTKQTRKKMVDYHSAGRGVAEQRFEYWQIDEDKEFDMMWEYCIVDWRGVVNSDGMGIECTREAKVRLMKEFIPFIRFVTKCQKRINAQFVVEEEIESKNSSTPQEDI